MGMGEMGRHIKIIAYKEPSRIHKVDYQLTVDELNAMTISDDFEIDKGVKQLIPNVNFGLLEKGGSTSQKSLAFKNLSKALAFQSEYGGKLNRLSDVEMLDEYGEQLTGKSNDYYILILKDKAELKNGF